MEPVIPKKACTAKTIRNDSSRLDVVAVKPSAPARIRNAPSEATMFIAWSAKKDFQEKTCCGGRGLSGIRVVATGSCRGDCDGVTGIASAGTCGVSGSGTMGTRYISDRYSSDQGTLGARECCSMGTAGAVAERWRGVCRRARE